MGFFKTMLRMNLTRIGNVSGSKYAHCYISTAKKDGAPALLIFGTKHEDFIFTKDDVTETKLVSAGAMTTMDGKPKIANTYQVTFKNGTTAVITVPVASSSKIENVLM